MIVATSCAFQRADHDNPFRLVEHVRVVTVAEVACKVVALYGRPADSDRAFATSGESIHA